MGSDVAPRMPVILRAEHHEACGFVRGNGKRGAGALSGPGNDGVGDQSEGEQPTEQ